MQKLAREKYALWKRDPYHPSLHFEERRNGICVVCLGDRYRAVRHRDQDGQAQVVPSRKRKLEGQAPSCPIIIPGNMEEIGRKHPVHQPVRERHNTSIIIFLTVCTKDRKPILANATAHEILLEAWRAARSRMTGRYIIMPGHVHLFFAPGDFIAEPLMVWVRYWKSYSARHWPRRGDAPIWQRHFWDTQLRRSENYDAKWAYVVENPVRAGLVSRSEDWPYQGELNLLRW